MIIILFTACEPILMYENATSFTFKDFPQNVNLKGEVVKKEIFSVPMGILCKDSVLFMYNVKGDYAINTINVNTWKDMGEFIEWGRGPEEVLYIKTLDIYKDKIHIFDKLKSQLLIYNFNDFCQSQKNKPLVTYSIDGIADGMLLLNDSLLIATSHTFPENRMTLFNKEGNVLKNIGKMPEIKNKKFTSLEKIGGFVCNMNMLPNGNIVLTYKLTDLIELYTPNGNLIKRLHGPDHFFPAKKEVKKGNLIRVRPEIGKERDSYRWRTVVNNEIWCLYSGKVFDPKADPYSNMLFKKIMVFSEELIPLKTYDLDIPIRAFTVDPIKKIIYGLQENSQEAFVIFHYN